MSHSKNNLEVMALQMTSVDSTEKNWQQIQRLLEGQDLKNTDLICLPENSLFMRVKEGDKIPGLKLSDNIFEKLSELAQVHAVHLHLGSVPLVKSDRLVNASVWINDQGKINVSYEKIHLFDIQLEGATPIRESDVFESGQGPSVIEINGWKIGQSICYDLRFAELYVKYAQVPVDIILIPSAFLVPTGRAHWDLLVRARAIESQSFVVAPAQAGVHRGEKGGERSTYGHSLFVDPWGEVIKKGEADRPEVLRATLSKSRLESVRKQIPMGSHRRLT